MKPVLRTGLLLAALGGVGALLAGCADEKQLTEDMHSSDFGRAVQEDLAAQIADPDAAYKGPPPPSSGERAQLAQKRYQNDNVVQPVGASTLQSAQAGGAGGGSGGSGGGGGGGSTGP
jgi:type IV pilus biogenesis protein CpaD/CtpE